MTTDELEQVIREYFLDIYKAEYLGKINIKKLEPFGYHISLGLNVPEKPLVICGLIEKDEDFLLFLKEELKRKHLHYNTYRTLTLIQPTNSNYCDKG